jgi:hypothetical protein
LTMDLEIVGHKDHSSKQSTYQTSCLCPATLAAGLKGSSRLVVADIARWGARTAGAFLEAVRGLNSDPGRMYVVREAEVISFCIASQEGREQHPIL